jgi:hypothetical protein
MQKIKFFTESILVPIFPPPWTLLLGAAATPSSRTPATPLLTNKAVLLSRVLNNVAFSQLISKHTKNGP